MELNSSTRNERLAKNTIFLYFRMFLIMGVTLYTSRVILKVLGVEDYGIYNVIGGLLAIFMSISGSLSNASIRFITYSLGHDGKKEQQRVFSSILTVHFLIALIVLVLCETIGLYMFYHKLVIPENRMMAAFWGYQFTIISLIFVFINLPYVAVITAHEKMNVYAYMSILDVLLRLGVVYFLQLFSFDKLAFYAWLLLAVQVVIQLFYWVYCRRNFAITKFFWVWNPKFLKEVFSYSSWIFVGSMASSLYTQGLNILLNMFFGPVVNAVAGIATQVQTAIMRFSQNFQTALQPQIILAYAQNESQRLFKLIITGVKFAYFLMFLIALPIMFQIDTILTLWLGEYPKETPIFVNLFIVICLLRNFSGPLMIAIQATSKIKKVELWQCSLLVALLVSYFFLKYFGILSSTVIVINVIADLIVLVIRVYVVLRQMCFSVKCFVLRACLPVVLVTAVSVIALYSFVNIVAIDSSILKLIIVVSTSILFMLCLIYAIGLNREEKKIAKNALLKIIHKK